MDYEPALSQRRSLRLQGYDYAKAGAYFVTVVTQDRLCLFGEIVDGGARLNQAGRLVADTWQWLETRYPSVLLDEYVVMPNHVHGLLVIAGEGGDAGDSRIAPTGEGGAGRKDLGSLIGAFKTVAAKRINVARGAPGRRLWQRNFYDRVVRSEEDMNHIRSYIRDNPLRWDLDAEIPPVGARRDAPAPS